MGGENGGSLRQERLVAVVEPCQRRGVRFMRLHALPAVFFEAEGFAQFSYAVLEACRVEQEREALQQCLASLEALPVRIYDNYPNM